MIENRSDALKVGDAVEEMAGEFEDMMLDAVEDMWMSLLVFVNEIFSCYGVIMDL